MDRRVSARTIMKAPPKTEITVVWRDGTVVRIDEYGRRRQLRPVAPLDPPDLSPPDPLAGDYEF